MAPPATKRRRKAASTNDVPEPPPPVVAAAKATKKSKATSSTATVEAASQHQSTTATASSTFLTTVLTTLSQAPHKQNFLDQLVQGKLAFGRTTSTTTSSSSLEALANPTTTGNPQLPLESTTSSSSSSSHDDNLSNFALDVLSYQFAMACHLLQQLVAKYHRATKKASNTSDNASQRAAYLHNAMVLALALVDFLSEAPAPVAAAASSKPKKSTSKAAAKQTVVAAPLPTKLRRRQSSWMDKIATSTTAVRARTLLGKLCVTLAAVGMAGLPTHVEMATLILNGLLGIVGDSITNGGAGSTATAASGRTGATLTLAEASNGSSEAVAMREYWEQHVALTLRRNALVVDDMDIDWTTEQTVWGQMSTIQSPVDQLTRAAATTEAAHVAVSSPGSVSSKRSRRAAKPTSTNNPTEPAAAPAPDNNDNEQSAASVHWINVENAYNQLLDKKLDSVRVDGRLAMKRWPGVAVVWFLHGQTKLLQTAAATENVAVACQLLSLFAQVTHAGGAKQPSAGGIDAFCRVLTGLKKSARVEANVVRELAIVAIHSVLVKHAVIVERECLDGALVNTQHGHGDAKNVFPYVAVAIEDCVTATAVNDIGSSALERIEATTRLGSAVGAYVLQLEIMDCRLLRFAVDKLKSCLDMEVSGTSINWDKTQVVLRLEEPLSTPLLSTTKQTPRSTKKKSIMSEELSLAGIYSEKPGGAMKQDVRLALFCRAMHGKRSSSVFEGLLCCLIDIAERCYGVLPSKLVGKKRIAGEGNDKRKGKRRKKNDGQGEGIDDTHTQALICSGSMLLATSVFASLSACLYMKTGDARMDVRHQFRSSLTKHGIFRIIDLCLPIDAFIQRTRGRVVDDSSATFSDSERNLWNSYVNLCTCIGSGQQEFESSGKVVLGNMRMAIFEKIGQVRYGSEVVGWPMWLPASLRSLVTSNLAAESRASSGDVSATAPDRFVVDQMIESIAAALKTPTTLERKQPISAFSFLVDEDTALSLNNARLFVAAAARLPQAQRYDVLALLFNTLHASLQDQVTALQDGKDKGRLREIGKEMLDFLARLVALITNCVVILTCSEELPARCLSVAGRLLESTIPRVQPITSGHEARKYFVSVLENSVLFDINEDDSNAQHTTMDDESCKRFQLILEWAFLFGLRSACTDQCYLLFSSWQALGMSDLWRPNAAAIRFPVSFQDVRYDVSALINELRFEMVYVSRLLQQGHGVAKTSSLTRVVLKKDSERMTRKTLLSKAAKEMQVMLSKASTLVQEIVSVPADNLPFETPALLEVLCVYVSFALSSCTRTKTDFLSHLQLSLGTNLKERRERAFLSEDEGYSDVESVISQSNDSAAWDRLQIVCAKIHSVPAHPDWLDSDCILADSLSYDDVRDMAVKALDVLNLLADCGWNRAHMLEAIATRRMSGDSLDTGTAKLMQDAKLFREDKDDESTPSTLSSALAAFCRAPKDIIDLLCTRVAEESRSSISATWTAPALQKIGLRTNGKVVLACRSELRAMGQWESLLTSALSTFCVDFFSDKMLAAGFVEKCRWDGVFRSAVETMIPAAALLRFGLQQGCRGDHPLKSPQAPVVDFKYMEFSVGSDCICADDTEPVAGVVAKTLATVSRFEWSGNETAVFEAVAANLVNDMRSFAILRGASRARFIFRFMTDLQETSGSKMSVETVNSLRFMFKRLAESLEQSQFREASQWRSSLRACVYADECVATITSRGVSVSTLVSGPVDDVPRDSRRMLLKGVLSILWRDFEYITISNRHIFAHAVCVATGLDNIMTVATDDICDEIAVSINQCSEIGLKLVIERDIFEIPEDDDAPATAAEGAKTRSIFCSLLAASLASKAFTRAHFILDNMMDIFKPSQEQCGLLRHDAEGEILGLMCLYSCFCGTLDELANKLMTSLNNGDSVGHENVEMLSRFLERLHDASVPICAHDARKSKLLSSDPRIPEASLVLPRFCSFTEASDFLKQHWYHCYTCGLTDDKGCCTLCALVCHANHDVSYARFSAFFCDCGAESKASDGRRTAKSCRCQSPIEADEASRLYRTGQDGKRSLCPSTTHRSSHAYLGLSPSHYADLASSWFAELSHRSLDAAVKLGRCSRWTTDLLTAVRAYMELARPPTLESRQPSVLSARSYGQLRSEIIEKISERANAMINSPEGGSESMVRAAHFRPASFQTRISLESHVESLKRALLTSNGSHRFAISADRRGRLVTIEPQALVICTMTPLLNKFGEHTLDQAQAKSSINIIGKQTIDFDAVGVRHSPFDDRYMAIWGTHETAAVFLNEASCQVKAVMTLDIGLGCIETSTDLVMECDWISGTYPCVMVRCLHSLFLFELSLASAVVSPISRYIAPPGITLRGVKVVEGNEGRKMFVLLESGCLFTFDLHVDSQGRIRLPTLSFELESALNLSPAISHELSATPLHLGGGQQLSFLTQSRLLLSECTSGGVVAVKIDSEGKIRGGYFTLLPSAIPVDKILGAKGESSPVNGPFTHWVDLGVVDREGHAAFRACCVGRRGSRDAALLCIEFSHRGAVVTELVFHPNDQSYNISASIEGVAAFSGPLLKHEEDCFDLGRKRTITENIALAVLLSNGSMVVFMEKTGAPVLPAALDHCEPPTGSCLESNVQMPLTAPPLLAFEELENLSNGDDVSFTGFSLGSSDEVRSKLQCDNELFLMGPSASGFSMNLTLKSDTSYRGDDRRVVAGLRVLVGSTSSDSVPRKIIIQGRDLVCSPGRKRWYCHLLTAQEIALTIRCGFLCLSVGPSFDSSTRPVLDALEVFAVNRGQLRCWEPKRLESLVPIASKQVPNVKDMPLQSHGERTTLACLAAYMRFCRLIRPEGDLEANDLSLLEDLIVRHALDETDYVLDMVDKILECYAVSDDKRSAFEDNAVLSSCLLFLSTCEKELHGIVLDTNLQSKQFQSRLRKCFKTASMVARSRPINYYEAVAALSTSPGIKASKFLPDIFEKHSANLDLISDFVELCLLEIIVGTRSGLDANQRLRLGDFDGLKKLLASANQSIVAPLCSSVTTFCRRCEDPLNKDDDLFAGRKIYYACDSCGEFPMKGTRYSLPDEARPFDLCEVCYSKVYSYASDINRDPLEPAKVGDRSIGDATKLTCGEARHLLSVAIDSGADTKASDEGIGRHVQFENFIGRLFDAVLSVISASEREVFCPGFECIVLLAADITRHFADAGNRKNRADRLAKMVMERLARSIVGDTSPRSVPPSLLLLLQTMTRMIIIDHGSFGYFYESDTYMEDISLEASTQLCAHKIPTVRRKYTSGRYKDRVFAICAKDSKFRCNFFAWSDAKSINGHRQEIFDEVMAGSIWKQLCWSTSPGGESPSEILLHFFADCMPSMLDKDNIPPSCFDRPTLKDSAFRVDENERTDGVLASLCRLHDVAVQTTWTCLKEEIVPDRISSEGLDSVIKAATALMALLARSGGESNEKWRVLLCDLIVSRTADSVLGELAKRALYRLCGKTKALYVSTRAHYSFSFHCERLIAAAEVLFQEGQTLLEKSRQMSGDWRKPAGKVLCWQDLSGCDMLCVGDLVSEDIATVHLQQRVLEILCDIHAVAKKRGDQWRQFCGLENCKGTLVRKSSSLLSADLRNLSPAILLLLAACLSGSEIQAKTLRLLEISMSPSPTRKAPPVNGSESVSTPGADNNILHFSARNACTFAMKFICYSMDNDSRRSALSILSAMLPSATGKLPGHAFHLILEQAIPKTRAAGKNMIEIFTLLEVLVSKCPADIDMANAAKYIQSCWKQQMQALRYDRANQSYSPIEVRTKTSSLKKRYELNSCIHCMITKHKEKGKQHDPQSLGTGKAKGSCAASNDAPMGIAAAKLWLPEQVVAYTSGRLEGWRIATVSDAFNAYSSLKYRLVLSEIHAEINEPRGRHVKTLTIYFTPRPVSDVAQLKSTEYAPNWQKCGKMHFDKDGSRASCVLDKPIVAANLRIEYTEFYERAGSSKSADGSFIVHCPRCNRVVNNAHGVCGSCGEVAFQCRKCRKINYDRLDAFLCIECGYCSSASSLLFELTAAIASNAIAITNDDDFELSRRMFAVASRLHEDLHSMLLEQLAFLPRASNEGALAEGTWRKGLIGDSPFASNSGSEKISLSLKDLVKGSVIKAIARADNRQHETRMQSLFRLTREGRESAAVASEGNHVTSILDQISRDMQLDDDESADELISLLESSAASRSNRDDVVNRLLSSVQNRRQRREAADATSNSAPTAGSSAAPTSVAKEKTEMCDRLYSLMKEAERESHLLEMRINAWQRLEAGTLILSARDEVGGAPFEPSHCSTCSTPVAVHLLLLWLVLLEAAPGKVEIRQDMIQMLFTENFPFHRRLVDIKRQAIQSIALHSQNGGTDMVFDALRVRLEVDPDSMQCTEILSKIIEAGGPQKFTDLSLAVLQASTTMDFL